MWKDTPHFAPAHTHITTSSGFIYFLSVSFSFHCLKGLIRGFYNAPANQQTCLLLLPLTWMQQQPSFPFCRLPGEHIKHMPSAPEAMKYKSTNKWISNHKGKKNKEAFKLCGKVTGSSEQFLFLEPFLFVIIQSVFWETCRIPGPWSH